MPFKVPFKEVPQNQADEPTAAAVKPASSESPKGITPKTSVSPQTVNNDVIEINTDSEQEDEMPSRKTTSAKSSFSALTSFEELSDDDDETESPEIQQADGRSHSELAFRYLDCQFNGSVVSPYEDMTEEDVGIVAPYSQKISVSLIGQPFHVYSSHTDIKGIST